MGTFVFYIQVVFVCILHIFSLLWGWTSQFLGFAKKKIELACSTYNLHALSIRILPANFKFTAYKRTLSRKEPWQSSTIFDMIFKKYFQKSRKRRYIYANQTVIFFSLWSLVFWDSLYLSLMIIAPFFMLFSNQGGAIQIQFSIRDWWVMENNFVKIRHQCLTLWSALLIYSICSI